jgi:predicted thioesterase
VSTEPASPRSARALHPGLSAEIEHVVGEQDTAEAQGSGDVRVLATPRVLALAEAASVRAVADQLAVGRTSVGVRADLHHRAASVVGRKIRIGARLDSCDGERLDFAVTVYDGNKVVASGHVWRHVVDRAEFLARAQGTGKPA